MKTFFPTVFFSLSILSWTTSQCPATVTRDCATAPITITLNGEMNCSAAVASINYQLDGDPTIHKLDKVTCGSFPNSDPDYDKLVGASTCLGSGQNYTLEIGGNNCYYTSAGVLLPVFYNYFKATPQNNHILLTWQTASELNNEGFYIERSKDAQNWQELDFVKGNGTTDEAQTYIYTDNKAFPFNKSYYRLRQVDYDGQFEYSKIVEIERPSQTEEVLLVLPNPLSATSQIYFFSPQKQEVDLVLFNAYGQVITSQVVEMDKGENQLLFWKEKLVAGTYFLVGKGKKKILAHQKVMVR